MLTLEKSKIPWSTSTFASSSLCTKFREKYKGWKANIVIRYSEGIFMNIMDESENLYRLVNDWGACSCTLAIAPPSATLTRFNFAQPVLLCSSVILSSPSHFNDNLEEFLEDFLYLMGYTNIFVSQRNDSPESNKYLLSRGYVPYMELNNRRTLNNVTLYTKTLKAWCFK